MAEEGFLDSSRPSGDPVGCGSHRRSRSGIDWVDNEGAMGRGHVRPNTGLGLGSGFGAADAQAGQGSSRKRVGMDDARRRDSVNLDDEDDVMIRNGSATREAPFKGLKTNDINDVWNHGPKYSGGFHCLYCNMQNGGGGATRFKEHLGKIGGQVKECPNVPRNVHDIMRKAVLEMRKKKREKENRKLRFERELMDEMYQRNGVINIDDDKDEEIQMALRESLRDSAVFEEDEDIVKLNYREKEIDPCAMMMDTSMHDESNPMMEWLNEDEEHIILDGSDVVSAVFEEIRRLNSRRKASQLGRKEISRKGKRVIEEEEGEYIESEDDDEANGSMDIDDGDDGQEEDDGQDDESDGEGLPRQAKKDARNQVNDIEVTSDGSLVNRRSGRSREAKRVKDVNSLYY